MLYSFLLFSLILTASPKRSFACEVGLQMTATQLVIKTAQDAAYNALASALNAFISSKLSAFSSVITVEVDVADSQNRDELDRLWSAWKTNLEGMTEQLSVAGLDRSRQEGSFQDAQIQGMVARDIEKKELQAFRKLAPSDKMCVADSVAPHTLKADEVKKAVSVAKESEIFAGGIGIGALNMQGTVSARGADAALNAKFNTLINNYRDPNYNGGEVPPGPVSTRIGNQYNVAKTIFGRDTIDLNDPNNRQDIEVFASLALGWPVYDPIPPSAVNTNDGRMVVLNRRAYQTRLNNYFGALMDPVARRSSVTAAPEVDAIRQANGVLAANIAARPSYMETMKARFRQMWSPRYMKDLNEPVHTAEQKQVDMYTLKIMDLQDMTWNMERMGMVLAARLGQRLDGVMSKSIATEYDNRPR